MRTTPTSLLGKSNAIVTFSVFASIYRESVKQERHSRVPPIRRIRSFCYSALLCGKARAGERTKGTDCLCTIQPSLPLSLFFATSLLVGPSGHREQYCPIRRQTSGPRRRRLARCRSC